MINLIKERYYYSEYKPNEWVYITEIYYNTNKKKWCAVLFNSAYDLYERTIFLHLIDDTYYEAISLPFPCKGEYITKMNMIEGDITMMNGL